MANTQPELHINLASIARNYRALSQHTPSQTIAAVLKANAYGLGAHPISQTLANAGCQFFYAAHVEEAIELRQSLGHTAQIAVLHGIAQGQEPLCKQHALIPVLNSPAQWQCWHEFNIKQTAPLPAIWHIDTGMNRLGFSPTQARIFIKNGAAAQLNISHIMSHLACSATPEHANNEAQWHDFAQLCQSLPAIPTSFAASGGTFHQRPYPASQARCGIALYGSSPVAGKRGAALDPALEFSVTLRAPILQIRSIESDGFVGYDASYAVKKGARIATAAIGYADGYSRTLSNRGYGIIRGEGQTYHAPIAGIISMDLCCFDVSHIPESIIENTPHIELLSPDLGANELAELALTNSYSMFTGLGRRVTRHYHHDGNPL